MKNPITIIIVSILLALVLTLTIKTASAEEIEVVEIVMIPTPTPTPPPDPPVETKQYDHDPEDIELLARFLWISPLRDKEAKKTLLWVVFNRVDDKSDLFGDSLETVITTTEFKWYNPREKIESYRLEENRQIAREAMDEWVSEDHGYYVGRHVPKCGIYQEFIGERNRGIQVFKEIGGEPIKW